VAEVEVVADDDRGHPQPADEHSLDELLRFFLRLLLVEVDDHRGIDAGLGEQFQALFRIGEQARRRFGPYDRGGVAVERHHR
jgi:hypothetical protein